VGDKLSEQSSSESHLDILFKLDAQRRQEIDSVKIKMEEFLRSQIEFRHSIEMVTKGQDSLKERFEMGVSKTLTQLDKKFDLFMIEWGTKKAEDASRDKAILTLDNRADAIDDKFNKYLLYPAITVCVSILIAVLAYFFRDGH